MRVTAVNEVSRIEPLTKVLDHSLLLTSDFAKLPSGYQRDLQLIKAPLFRGIDVAMQVLDLVPVVLEGLAFRPERIRLDDDIHATARANALVVDDGLPFREAYRRAAKATPE